MTLLIPEGWAATTLGDLALWGSGCTPRRSEPAYFQGDIPWVTISDLNDTLVKQTRECISQVGLENSSAKLVAPGSIMVALYGSIGKLGIAAQKLTTNQAIAYAIPDDFGFDGNYLFHFLRSQRDQLAAVGSGVTQKNIYLGDLKAFGVLLAPRAEQTRIVEKLEELLSDLDAGVAELKAAQKKLIQYRQSLLKAAVEGALTADWRAARRAPNDEAVDPSSPPSFPRRRESSSGGAPETLDSRLRGNDEAETGAQLLARILTERRRRWETRQLAKFQAQGKTPPKDWQAKYPEPVAPDSVGLLELPSGWVWASLDQLAEFITSGSRGWAEYYAGEGATFIRSQNINKDRLDLSDIAFVNPPPSSEGARTLVKTDDLLLTITGATVGKAARVDIELEEAYVSQHVALIRLVDASLGNYFHLFLTAGAGGRGQLNKEAYGAGKPGLNLQQVGSVRIPLPGKQEVIVLMHAISAQFNAVQTQEAAITQSLKQSAAQRKNILQAAFSGQLVPQDPADEPASALLARIRAERAAREAGSARGRGKKKAAA